MAQPTTHVIHGGKQASPASIWTPFEWEEPKLGKQVHGEVTIARTFGTSGNLTSGFWRTGATSTGANANGSHSLIYSAPLGDETSCVIDGSATLTVVSTGKKYTVGPGAIISLPKGLEVQWEIDAPSFKKYWCIWNGTKNTASPPTDILINNVSDSTPEWTEYAFTEPKEGNLVAGELYYIRNGGSTGTMLSGVWRSGKGIVGSDVDAQGTMTTPYTGVLGDETILLLEGEVDIVETDSGKKHSFRAGDAIGLTSGMHITWISKGPFSKKLWVITRDSVA
ncbi:hypothetical protein T440DRAFT_535548 [Plenodomus tracheiphilus IPT5]|uniref:(S)-ureidoglycine aminohydrolase cupin domain-containing protein n=1 Tax=Plenodomus tracheiphilus IPT5 TaxID=1408161 RepID=A0A6A7BJW8_9PLEO|nr:hypothetical protein T440DRAFT_535548 [Plenodomus tracheiphilus IPT5]